MRLAFSPPHPPPPPTPTRALYRSITAASDARAISSLRALRAPGLTPRRSHLAELTRSLRHAMLVSQALKPRPDQSRSLPTHPRPPLLAPANFPSARRRPPHNNCPYTSSAKARNSKVGPPAPLRRRLHPRQLGARSQVPQHMLRECDTPAKLRGVPTKHPGPVREPRCARARADASHRTPPLHRVVRLYFPARRQPAGSLL